MTTPDPDPDADQAERRRVTLQDADVRRQQGATLHGFAQAQADETNQGRFRSQGVPSVTGTTAIPKYPQASGPWQGPDLVGIEPFLNYSIDELEPSTVISSPPSVEATGDPMSDGDAPSPSPLGDVQRADVGSPSSETDHGA